MMDDLISRQAVLEATSAKLKITGKENAETVYEYIKKLCDDIKALPSAQQWIPCSERLPEEEKEVLVYTDAGEMLVAYLFDDWGNLAWTTGGLGSGTVRVVAWMPLPKPPEEVKQDARP